MSTTRIENYDACYRSSREEPKAIQILGLVAKRLQGRRDNETNYKGALTLTQVCLWPGCECASCAEIHF